MVRCRYIYIPSNFFELMLKWHNLHVVAGVYHDKRHFWPVAFRNWKYDHDLDVQLYESVIGYKRGDELEIDFPGEGCVRIDRCVLEDVVSKYPPPYFKWGGHSLLSGRKDAEFLIKYGVDDASEGGWFYRRVRQAGFKILLDTNIQCDHGNVTYEDYEKRYLKQ